jgi:transcriptional regulator with XRE-family HTH domain
VITRAQIRAARKLLGWERPRLSGAWGVSTHTVAKAEGGKSGLPPTEAQLAAIRAVLETAGVEFTADEGVTLDREAAFRDGNEPQQTSPDLP